MMAIRWLFFCGGVCSWICIIYKIWHSMGWVFGVFVTVAAIIAALDWFEQTILKQWKMRKVTFYMYTDLENDK
jgi:hypothetical protein